MRFPKNVLLTSFIAFLLISCDAAGIILDGYLCKDAQYSCSEESIAIGDILLSEEVNSVFIYEKTDSLILKNETGDTLTFEVSGGPYYNLNEKEDINILCYSCKNESQVEYYNLEYSTISFISFPREPYYFFSLEAKTKRLKTEESTDSLFYEEIEVRLSKNVSRKDKVVIIPNIFEISGSFPKDFMAQNESYDFFKTITLLNREFDNVYAGVGNEDIIIYFSFESGFIGFKADEEIWLFDSIL